jgi:predicted RNA methylase
MGTIEAEFVSHSVPVTYNTASEMAAVYQQTQTRIEELRAELFDAMHKLNRLFNNEFPCSLTICEQSDPADIAREMKRSAWKCLIDKLGIEKVLSCKKREEMRETLCRNYRPKYGKHEDKIDKFPEISPETILQVLSGYASSADDFLSESVGEVYEKLKPGNWDEYKTNEKNRWKLSCKVIIPYGCSWCKITKSFDTAYSKSDLYQSLDKIFHLLDGRGLNQTYLGELMNAIHSARKTGQGESGYTVRNSAGEIIDQGLYFRFKLCKNNNVHLEILRPDLVAQFNALAGNKHELPGNATGGTYTRTSGNSQEEVIPVAPAGDYEFFQTPADLAETMATLADIGPGDTVLDPSAGGMRIANAAKEAGADVVCNEAHSERAKELERAGYPCTSANFLELKPGTGPGFDAVIMNPPFSRGQDCAHISHAWNFLKPGGRLVAIAAAGVKYRGDQRTARFREWLNNVGGVMTDLPPGTFSESGTDVQTVLIQATK